jgi:hypothetical protein
MSTFEELQVAVASALAVRSRKLSKVHKSWSSDWRPRANDQERALEGILSRWSRLHLQPSAPSIPHWARVVGYGSFSLCVIH